MESDRYRKSKQENKGKESHQQRASVMVRKRSFVVSAAGGSNTTVPRSRKDRQHEEAELGDFQLGRCTAYGASLTTLSH